MKHEAYIEWVEKVKNMTVVEALEDSIRHWQRMIRFVMQFENREDREPDPFFMQDWLGEDWLGSYCALCVKNDDNCEDCILAEFYMHCNTLAIRMSDLSIWEHIKSAKSWSIWLKYAVLMEEKLKECLDYARNIET